jgi:hypothetical protein
MEFKRPEDQPLKLSKNFRYGFWIETDLGSEGLTCGWGYSPLYGLPKFTCVSFDDNFNSFQEHYKDHTFTGFSNIRLADHYDTTWKLSVAENTLFSNKK